MSPSFQEGPLRTSRLTLHAVQQTNPAGPGPNVLLLGGSNFDLSLKSEYKRSALAQVGRLVTYEPRGIGRTERPDGAWSMADYAKDAFSAMDALGWDRAVIVGESFGGMTALHMAHMAPDRVSAMIISSTTAGGAGGGSYEIASFLSLTRADAAVQSLAILDTRNQMVARTDPDAYAQRLASRVKFETAFERSSIAHGGYARLLAARSAHDVWEVLSDITTPTLVLTGLYDAQAPVEAQRNMVGRLPNAQHWERSAGHGVMFSTPDVLGRAVAEWLPAVQAQGAAA